MAEIAGKKIGMTRIFNDRGFAAAITVIEAEDLGELAKGDIVSVAGKSKGKGFAGTVKRHNFSRGPKTHGSRNYRKPGSIGTMYPEHVIKGRRMPGRLGGVRTTVKNLEIADVIPSKKLILINGAVPGPSKGRVIIQKIVLKQKKEAHAS